MIATKFSNSIESRVLPSSNRNLSYCRVRSRELERTSEGSRKCNQFTQNSQLEFRRAGNPISLFTSCILFQFLPFQFFCNHVLRQPLFHSTQYQKRASLIPVSFPSPLTKHGRRIPTTPAKQHSIIPPILSLNRRELHPHERAQFQHQFNRRFTHFGSRRRRNGQGQKERSSTRRHGRFLYAHLEMEERTVEGRDE